MFKNCIIYFIKKFSRKDIFWTQIQTLDPPDSKGLSPGLNFSYPMYMVQ